MGFNLFNFLRHIVFGGNLTLDEDEKNKDKFEELINFNRSSLLYNYSNLDVFNKFKYNERRLYKIITFKKKIYLHSKDRNTIQEQKKIFERQYIANNNYKGISIDIFYDESLDAIIYDIEFNLHFLKYYLNYPKKDILQLIEKLAKKVNFDYSKTFMNSLKPEIKYNYTLKILNFILENKDDILYIVKGLELRDKYLDYMKLIFENMDEKINKIIEINKLDDILEKEFESISF